MIILIKEVIIYGGVDNILKIAKIKYLIPYLTGKPVN